MWFFKKKTYDPYANCDWKVYYQDFDNGMPWGEQQKKLAAGLYEKGRARPNSNYGRIDYPDRYKDDLKRYGKTHTELLRRIGCYMKDDNIAS